VAGDGGLLQGGDLLQDGVELAVNLVEGWLELGGEFPGDCLLVVGRCPLAMGCRRLGPFRGGGAACGQGAVAVLGVALDEAVVFEGARGPVLLSGSLLEDIVTADVQQVRAAGGLSWTPCAAQP